MATVQYHQSELENTARVVDQTSQNVQPIASTVPPNMMNKNAIKGLGKKLIC